MYHERVIAPGEDRHLALALVNSRRNGPHGPVDELTDVAGLAAWLAEHGLADADAGEADLAALRALRDAVRELLTARIEDRAPAPMAVEAVNAASRRAPVARVLDWEGRDAPRARRDGLGVPGAALGGALAATDAIELVTGPEHAALHACGAPGCVRLLLRDHPRRQWCSTRCGDRVRASRYYHRHTASGE
jgi:predicted RNA-binding Zn ribbon-like protein